MPPYLKFIFTVGKTDPILLEDIKITLNLKTQTSLIFFKDQDLLEWYESSLSSFIGAET